MSPLAETGQQFGVYIHIPFCTKRCDYCAFTTFTEYFHLRTDYIKACSAEIDLAAKAGMLRPATSVYVGGGTPSLTEGRDLALLISSIPKTTDAEITVEVNPESLTPDFCAAIQDTGVNRISMGVQSLVPRVLEDLGRPHYPGSVEKALELISQYNFSSHSVDIIYGAASETTEDLAETLDKVFAMDPGLPHLSAYALTVEQGTPLARDTRRYPDEDRQATFYGFIDEYLKTKGMTWYEISNWAKPSHACRHNELYWLGDPYLGIGCAAHGYIEGTRYKNTSSINRYLKMIGEGRLSRTQDDVITPKERELELLYLKLRTASGVPEKNLDFAEDLADLVRLESGKYTLTLKGRLLANEVAHRLSV
jgi:oxygen-independent coproporphyrinogen-3 oxidase